MNEHLPYTAPTVEIETTVEPTTTKGLQPTARKARFISFCREHWYLLLAMLIPAVLTYLIYVSKTLYPFGDGCVLVLDLNGQYVWFFEALRNFVRGDADLLYSFSRALGGEFLGIYAYYLASPLSFLLCLFPKERMLEGLLALFLIKTALCGGTFGYYMHRTMKERCLFAIVAFSIFYAMSSYALVQQHNTMWIDAVMWLPLITLGIEEMIRHGKYKLYTVSLAVTLFSNFYIGYMVCIYCLIYFFLYYIAHAGTDRCNPRGEDSHFVKSLLRMAFYSVLSVGIATVILLSAYYSLNFGKTTFSNPQWVWDFNFNITDLLYKFLPGSYDTVRPEGLPFLYCGMLTLLFLPAYFLSRKYPMRQKIVSAVFILIFIASMSFSVTDLIWHGFQRPNWLNYRYSFMLCFYLCVLACRAFAVFETVSLKVIAGTGGLIAIFCVFLQQYTSGEYVDPNDYTCIWFSLLCILVYLAVLGCMRSQKCVRVVSIVLIATVSVEVFLSGLWNLNGLDADVSFSRYSRYNNFLNNTRPIVEDVQASDTSFYRMEKTFFRNRNDNMALGIRGLSGSTSTLNKETVRFLNKMGYASESHWSKYLGGTPVSDSLLGLKYIVSDQTVYGNYYQVYKQDAINQYTAYYNPYSLSIAYGVDDALLDFPLGFVKNDLLTAPTVNDDGEEKPSKIGTAVDKVKDKLNEWFDIDETVNSAEYRDDYESPFERMNAIVTAMLGEDETVQVFVPIKISDTGIENMNKSYTTGHNYYSVIDSEDEASLTYSLQMPADAELFFYMPSDYPRELELTLTENGASTDCGTFHGSETSRIVSLGMQSAGDALSLKMTLKSTFVCPMIGEDYFYYIDWAVFEDAMARLATDQYKITEYTERSFEGSFTASREHELVMTTIAYDKGWKVFVDGQEIETHKALGSLVSFYVDGAVGQTHTVELVYSPNTFWIGLTISLISLAILIILIVLERYLRGVPILKSLVGIPLPIKEEPSPQDTACIENADPDPPVTELESNDSKD